MTLIFPRTRLLLSEIAGFWSRFSANRSALVGLAVLVLAALVSLTAPMTMSDPWKIGTSVLTPPNFSLGPKSHLFGTDNLGRDLLGQVAYGVGTSLLIGFICVVSNAVIGILAGCISGYMGGWVDSVIMRLTELMQIIPRFFLALLFVALFQPSIVNVIFVLVITSWPLTARIVRSEYLSLRAWEFVEAARSVGARKARIIFSEILPNAIGPVIVNSTLQGAEAILIESGLAFLGMSDLNTISLGYLCWSATPVIRVAWWMMLFPGLAISILILAFNLVGEGLSEAYLSERLSF